jgi:hypothetical protein
VAGAGAAGSGIDLLARAHDRARVSLGGSWTYTDSCLCTRSCFKTS